MGPCVIKVNKLNARPTHLRLCQKINGKEIIKIKWSAIFKVKPPLASDFTILLSHHWISDFQSVLINSKKIQKNIKFGLQAHFNMEITSNGSDWSFELSK